MTCEILRKRHDLRAPVQQVLVLSLIVISGAVAASAQKDKAFFSPGNLVVSRSVYGNNPNNVQVGELLAAKLPGYPSREFLVTGDLGHIPAPFRDRRCFVGCAGRKSGERHPQ